MESRVFLKAMIINNSSVVVAESNRLDTWTPGVPADGDGADHKMSGPCCPCGRPPDDE